MATGTPAPWFTAAVAAVLLGLATTVAVACKRACVMAQQNLHNLLKSRPVYYIDEKGERVFLDDAAHKAGIEHQRQLIRENCNNE